ncbi:MAG TPA: class I SAM-dependent methyltransferase [Candidatus Saccharimonadales bacterium]|nr:class I SAM-dependent methyltransferase [Candidatus Saccharimonadales bacterium]
MTEIPQHPEQQPSNWPGKTPELGEFVSDTAITPDDEDDTSPQQTDLDHLDITATDDETDEADAAAASQESVVEDEVFFGVAENNQPDTPPAVETTEYDKISVTAINNAKLMTRTGIPLYEEIAETAEELWAAGEHDVQPQLIQPNVNAPGIEVRYRLGNELTADAAQVFDIAAGLTPRGLTMTTNNPDLTYVEFDLPVMTDLKTRVVETLEDRQLAVKSDNLHLEAGNATDAASMVEAARHLDPDQPVTITSEGLLHYLSHDEKAAVAQGIGALLTRHGGVWYTDMPVQEGIAGRGSAMASTTTRQTGRSIADNRFANEAEAREFFAGQGLEVKQLHSYVEPGLVDSLTSPAIVGVTREEVVAANRPWSMWAIGLPEPDDEPRPRRF